MKSSKLEYIRAIIGDDSFDGYESNLTKDHKDRIKEALKQALEIRKFEIEMYWKRAQYFWAFLITIYGSYFIVYAKTSPVEDYQRDLILLILSTMGMFFSVGWHVVNRGSKFWQNNWEHHVDALEDYVYGPLYKTIIARTDYGIHIVGDCYFTPVHPYPFSVSKINCLLSSVFFIGSMGLMFVEAFKWNAYFSLWVSIVLALMYMFISYSSSDIAEEYSQYKKDPEQPVFFLRKRI
jgi:hypothetical protein